jgi:predicted Zn-dependent protease
MTFEMTFRTLLGACLALGVAGCTSLTGEPEIGVQRTSELPSAEAVSPGAREMAAAASERQRILANYGGVYRHREAEILVAQIAGQLLTAAEQPNQTISVTVMDSPEINAFALPGGDIYITRGMLALANDTSEIAAVVAHEMAHVILHHAQARQNRARTNEIVDRVLGGILGVDVETDQVSNRARASLAAFSQQQELEADSTGIGIAAKAGYDPYAAARFLGVMGRYAALTQGENAPGLRSGDFLSSHPSTPSRIEKAIGGAEEIGVAGGFRGRAEYLAAIDGISFGNNPDTGAIVGNRYVHKNFDLTFEVPERYTLTLADDGVVATSQDGAAMRFDTVNVPAEMGLGEYLASGWIAGLVPESMEIRRIGGTEVAQADALTEQWVFRIAALRHEGRLFRFIFAAAHDSDQFKADFRRTIDSFRGARLADTRRIRSFEIAVVEAKPGDTGLTLAARMEVNKYGPELFYSLNGLFPEDPLVVGAPYKIVVQR